MQPVRVLRRVDTADDRVLVDASRQRQLDDVGRAGGVVVEPVHGLLHVGLRGGGGQLDADRLEPDLRAVLVLGVDVPAAARVVPDEHRAEPRYHAALSEGGESSAQLGLDRGRRRLAVEDLRSLVHSHGNESVTAGWAHRLPVLPYPPDDRISMATRAQLAQGRSRQRREELLAAAIELFAEGGSRAATHRAVARPAGLPPAT